MKTILDQLEGRAPMRKEATVDLFVSQRNYFGMESSAKIEIPSPNAQVGATNSLATIVDGNRMIKLAPGEVYDAGERVLS